MLRIAMLPSLRRVLLLWDQVISNGRSPLLIEQVKEVESPVFIVSSPKLKGKIWGDTRKKN